VATICRRELAAVFSNPVAAVFILAFLLLSAALTFHLGGFFARGQADLQSFFRFHPWLHLFLMPALGMRLWAEERRSGTLELLRTLPIHPASLVWGKFLAVWITAGAALALTGGMAVTVGILGEPDWGPILGGYLGSWLMAGGFLAVAGSASALTRNQVIAFVVAAAACFVLIATGSDLAASLLQNVGLDAGGALAGLSVLTHFDNFVQGNLTLQSAIFFLSLIGVALYVNVRLIAGMDGG
jgi:ABC-2 type transport system permease protein